MFPLHGAQGEYHPSLRHDPSQCEVLQRAEGPWRWTTTTIKNHMQLRIHPRREMRGNLNMCKILRFQKISFLRWRDPKRGKKHPEWKSFCLHEKSKRFCCFFCVDVFCFARIVEEWWLSFFCAQLDFFSRSSLVFGLFCLRFGSVLYATLQLIKKFQTFFRRLLITPTVRIVLFYGTKPQVDSPWNNYSQNAC